MSRSTMRLSALSLLFAALALVLLAPPAAACSCAFREPEEALREADAAFVGTLVSLRGDRWTFDVEAVLAGELPAEFTFRSIPADGANCGISPDAGGGDYGLVLYREPDGQLTSNGCLRYDPDLLLAAGEPREPTPGRNTGAGDDRAAAGSGGWVLALGTAAAGAAVLGGVAWWGRRRPPS